MNAFNVVREFEQTIADYAGAKYGISCESLSLALEMCCAYKKVKEVEIPRHTYISVPCGIIHAGGTVKWRDEDWEGCYELKPYGIIDSALRFKKDMYIPGSLYCLSFHLRKLLPIGRGGMILTDDPEAARWLRKARFDGRTEDVPIADDVIEMVGWNGILTPEQAARGLFIFHFLKNRELADIPRESQGYPDLSKFEVFNEK
jgi:dTDP-4-amino-4,6-dideoxygalactose transaminase